MTKLQRKRRAARYRRLFRRHDQALLNFHVALDQKHEWQVSRSVYHRKRPAWLYCIATRGARAQSVNRLLARLKNMHQPMSWSTLNSPSLADILGARR